MNESSPIRHQREIPDVLQAMAKVHETMSGHGFERAIHHLIQVRASQMNRCAHCVKMHVSEAREDGESNERLDSLVVWDHSSVFNEREKAALAWTEALTELNCKSDYAALRVRLRLVFSEKEISVLTATIAMINAWNRLQIAGH